MNDMIKKFINYILVLMVCLSCFVQTAGAQEIQVFSKLEQGTIRMGDQTRLRLSVVQGQKDQVTFPKLKDTLTAKIQVLSSSKPDTLRDKTHPEQITVTQSLVITSFDAGAYVIAPFEFRTKDAVLKTSEAVLTVEGVKVDTTKAIYDIKQPLAVSYSWTDWVKDNWIIVLGTVLVVLAIGTLIWYLKKRPAKVIAVPAKPAVPVHTQALNKLNELRDKKLWQQNEVKLYYSELSDVLREYLEKRYQIKTHERTTDEIFAGLRYLEIEEENKTLLHQLLILADLVKFAKEQPSSLENENSMEQAILFVLNTQAVIQPKIAEGGSDAKPV